MKLSVLANLYAKKSLEETLQILTGLGVHTVEIGAGGYPGKDHCDPAELLADPAKFHAFTALFKKYDVSVCALAAHGNALHPDAKIASQFDEDFRNAVLLAEKMGDESGAVRGANFDPSHLIWQGMDPVAAIRELEGAIYHVHAKDTKIDHYNTARNGVLDTKHYGDELHRAWVFRTVGYGNGESYWRDLVSNLRLVGYDRVLSIEHEDSLMSIDEGLKKAVTFLQDIVIDEPKPTTMAWA